MDLPQGLYPVIRYNIFLGNINTVAATFKWPLVECESAALAFEHYSPRSNFRSRRELPVSRPSPGKLVGLLFGGVVIVVMFFMMFVILGNLFMGEQ
jgi:hypothetical protein